MSDAASPLELRSAGAPIGARGALRDLSLRVEREEVFVVLGPNGCGKSTLLRLCTGLARASEGQVLLFGREVSALRAAELEGVRRRTGVVFEDGALAESLTLAENVALPLVYRGGLPAAERRERVDACLAAVGLAEDAARRPSELSLGERKRAAFARALALEPELLLLDDPTSDLDTHAAAEVVRLVLALRERTRATFFIVSNDVLRFTRAADRVAVLFGGTFTTVGAPRDVMHTDSDPWLARVFESSLARNDWRATR